MRIEEHLIFNANFFVRIRLCQCDVNLAAMKTEFCFFASCMSTLSLWVHPFVMPLILLSCQQNVDGVNYFHVKIVGLLFVATTRTNVSPSLVLELLQRIARVIKDYLGILSEESLRKNFVLVYELLDEVIVSIHYPIFLLSMLSFTLCSWCADYKSWTGMNASKRAYYMPWNVMD